MKYMAMLGDKFIPIEADSEEAAQELAFAKTVRALKPQDFNVWVTWDADEWREDELS